MAALFAAVLQASAYGTVVALFILVIKKAVNKKLNAQWHYLLWIILIFKLLVPYGPESAVSLFNAVPDTVRQNPVEFVNPAPPGTDRNIINETPAAPLQPTYPGDADVTAPAAFDSQEMLSYAWAAGGVMMLCWLVFTYLTLQRKLRFGRLPADERIVRIFNECRVRMGVGKNINLILHERISTPSVLGLTRPRILLPPAMQELDDTQLQYILLHELAHLRRRDLFVNYLLLAVQVVHWFNPVMWYCFRRIREDMEVATDECVLSFLETGEHRAYGRTLLAVLERFSTPAPLPKLLGMVDDKKNIERRIRMIKMAETFRANRRRVLLAGLVCLVVLGGLLLTNGVTGEDAQHEPFAAVYDVETLLSHRTPYVGNSSKVSNLLMALPLAEYRENLSLQTNETPYGVTVNYDFTSTSLTDREIAETLRNNAALMFALIDNVDIITFGAAGVTPGSYRYERSELEQDFGKDLREFAVNNDTLQLLVSSLMVKIHVFPDGYTPAMSHVPGIRISVQYPGKDVNRVRYIAEHGTLVTWDEDQGIVSSAEPTLEVFAGEAVFWTSRAPDQARVEQSDTITVILLNASGAVVAQKQIVVDHDGEGLYTVRPSPHIVVGRELPTSLEDAVSAAIKAKGAQYRTGEFLTEGHVILDQSERNGTVTAYTLASVNRFGFENGIFTNVSGSGAIPTVMTFSVDELGQYTLVDYKEALDGGGYADSIREMFPRELWDEIFSGNAASTQQLVRQQETQAAEYLQTQGIQADVKAGYVEKTLPNIDVPAANKLFAEMTKENELLNRYPYWLGTRGTVEDGVRYTYETAQDKTADGYDRIIFSKTTEDGTVVEQWQFKIANSRPELIEQFSRPEERH
ncbi:MAG: M56 family metallopeptidase [Bacillota bacterium]|nr:M56 family metallopeptidase [Bacillota bacterium]MDW7683293.1 M56 family metallopeptidase [Bacillota bacterium]